MRTILVPCFPCVIHSWRTEKLLIQSIDLFGKNTSAKNQSGKAKGMRCVYRHADGSLSSLNPSMADLQRLPQPHSTATLLFVVNAASGLTAGEAVFDVAQLQALASEVKAKALQVQILL